MIFPYAKHTRIKGGFWIEKYKKEVKICSYRKKEYLDEIMERERIKEYSGTNKKEEHGTCDVEFVWRKKKQTFFSKKILQ